MLPNCVTMRGAIFRPGAGRHGQGNGLPNGPLGGRSNFGMCRETLSGGRPVAWPKGTKGDVRDKTQFRQSSFVFFRFFRQHSVPLSCRRFSRKERKRAKETKPKALHLFSCSSVPCGQPSHPIRGHHLNSHDFEDGPISQVSQRIRQDPVRRS